ncbi:tRNA (adenine(22)-N(1))-methyltransferase [Inediibacterium massiliense]|uniref:tRNA (adenine(22)-N(1))-methyltransferase n=1 Tax=Inediibacterium massiliense TaxID=1658111 RepID=UPI0006B6571A|nr:class I SAM-dependent methyltransferase [Inediibacterium massiliense]
MKLTNRLLAITKFVKKGSSVADVGTDHGYIPVYLVKNHISKEVIATDVNEGPLNSAKETIKEHGLEKYIQTRLGSGLVPIKSYEVDTVIIAGMGGLLIRDILKNDLEVTRSIKRFILQPMVAQEDLRKWLIQNHFKIVDEKLEKEDHRIYEIMVVEKGEQMIEDEIYYKISKKLIENKDPLLEVFIQKHIQKQKKIFRNLEGQISDKANEKRNECIEELRKLEEVLEWLKK